MNVLARQCFDWNFTRENLFGNLYFIIQFIHNIISLKFHQSFHLMRCIVLYLMIDMQNMFSLITYNECIRCHLCVEHSIKSFIN